MKFPIYALRQYVSIYEEGMYKIIETHKCRWVLDHKYPTDNNYWERRLQLLTDPFIPYKLYPLKKKVTSLAQMLRLNTRHFIDGEGTIHVYTKSTFYKLKYAKIEAKWKTAKGYTAIKSREVPTTYIIKDEGYSHFGYIKVGRRFELYELCYEEKPERRIKI